MEKDFLYKNRSFSSCLNTAYEWFCDNFKTIIRVTWLPVLFYSIFAGLLLVSTLRDPRVQAFAENLPWLYLTLFILANIGVLVCGLWAWARFLSLLNGMTCKNNILRLLIFILCYIVIISIVGTLVVGGAFLLIRHMGVTPLTFITDNWLVCLVSIIILILLILPLIYSFMKYLFKTESNFLLDLHKTYPTGLRHLGFIFTTIFITSIITGIIAIVMSLPQTILMMAQIISAFGVLHGDPSGMPSYFIPLHGTTTAITTILLFYLSAYTMLVTMFMYGSIEKEEEERRSSLINNTEVEPTDNDNSFKTV
jgi:hypothetical protein